jgi:hypothetical protein
MANLNQRNQPRRNHLSSNRNLRCRQRREFHDLYLCDHYPAISGSVMGTQLRAATAVMRSTCTGGGITAGTAVSCSAATASKHATRSELQREKSCARCARCAKLHCRSKAARTRSEAYVNIHLTPNNFSKQQLQTRTNGVLTPGIRPFCPVSRTMYSMQDGRGTGRVRGRRVWWQ